jgi:hypothetical protein
MADEQTPQEQSEQSLEVSGDAWREVGQQFRALGESLAAAVRAAFEREETQQHLQELQNGLKAMVNEVDQAVREVSASPEGQRVRAEVERAAQTARSTGEQIMREAQPHLVSALRQVSEEIQKMINHLEEGAKGGEGSEGTEEAEEAKGI